MPLKLTQEEIKILMRFVSRHKTLNLTYVSADEVYLVGERNNWAHQIINYLRLVQKMKAEGKTDEEIFQPAPEEPAIHIWVNRQWVNMAYTSSTITGTWK